LNRIFFYGNINIDDRSIGITKKVLSQIATLRSMGYEVFYTGYTNEGVAIFNNNGDIVKSIKYWTKSDKLNRYLRRWNLLRIAKKYISETREVFDYAYLRFHFFDSAYLSLVKKLKKTGAKIIVEAHGYPYKKQGLSLYTPTYILDSLYEPLIRKYIDLVAAISGYDNIWGCKTVQIDNAINLNDLSLQNKISVEDEKLRLISVSNERGYHGYPKIIRGLSEYYIKGGKRDIEINFVGDFKNSTKQYVNELNLNNRIHFLGKKSGEELIDLYNHSDLGIGSLDYRAGSEYGSSIKAKEYFALGLPFINGWREYAFDDSYPYVKRFNLADDSIDINEVLKFYDSIKNDPKMPFEMREFAKENYTWKVQFEKIFRAISLNK
jgi:glycosyltransferase involved in cell wall biosynthesis